ncbi:MAG: DUF389 domain-containing protein [Alphaproteobacteria bacterium]|uniref:DUF389 domain-containing protein n=1 Tax=Candidatus Nitrobium versatile TaxID=2884831 RepID=A0A953M3B7_9BACT|nr:DUF389 domain-containing protein [Candidatus Nitrobium versatile]
MILSILQAIRRVVRHWLQKKADSVNRPAVIRDIYKEVDISAGFFLIATIANLIALCGLLLNSPPVIIGAMLISPLMSPILNIGFSFITGDSVVLRKSAKKISLGVAVTIGVAALGTLLSPLKDVTPEILARTQPNLYDLIIAFLAGTAGAGAICTKRSYLTIVPGVAIATAVIPPLSVTGFGIGTGNLKILQGGFLLFFTNFVAIVLSTCFVFFLYGFRPGVASEQGSLPLRRRIVFLSGVLFIISIPLFYTLQESIREVRLRKNVQKVLQETFNHEGNSNLASFLYTKSKEGELSVSAVINTVHYLKEGEIRDASSAISSALGRKVELKLEQIRVLPGGLKDDPAKPPSVAKAPEAETPAERFVGAREQVLAFARQVAERIEKITSPSLVADYRAVLHPEKASLMLSITLRRDMPLSEQEKLFLQKMFAAESPFPIELDIERVPFLPALIFRKGETTLSAAMKKDLEVIRDGYRRDPALLVIIEAYSGSAGAPAKDTEAKKRIAALEAVLCGEYGIPAAAIKKYVMKKRASHSSSVRVSLRSPLR